MMIRIGAHVARDTHMNSSIGVSPKQAARRISGTVHSVLACLVLAFALAATPQDTRTWVPVGAPGGSVRALAMDPRDPRRIYLGTAEGILYRSDDGGRRWNRLTPGFPLRGCSLDEIVVDPRGAVLIGYWEVRGQGGGIARSTDEGQTFVILKGIQGQSVRALAVAPSDPRMIAAGTLSAVFLSRDGGKVWTRITPRSHPDLRNFGSLAFDPTDPEVIYAGTRHLAWKTVNGGASWIPVHRGMMDDSDVMTLTPDSRDPRTIYATACSGIYRSTASGAEWRKLSGIPYSARRTRAFRFMGDDPNVLLAGTTQGLWISENGGGTWSRTTSKQLVINSVIAQPGGTILLGTEGAGVLRSSDRGRTWVASNTGFSEQFVYKLLFDSADDRLIVVVRGAPGYSGVFVSQGAAGRWVRLGDGLDGREVLSLALLGRTILAGTDGGIFKRAPDARMWTPVPIAIDGQEAPSRVTDLLALDEGRLVAATSTGVIHSSDGGETWTRPKIGNDAEVFALAASHGDANLVVAATKSGFFRSNDGGKSWRRTSIALNVTPHALTFVPSNARVLFVTTTGGLFRSSDLGATWRRVNGGLPHSDLTGLAINPDGRTIYVSDFTWGGVFRSADGGSTWDRMPTTGLGSDRVWTLSVDPAMPERVLAGSSAGGLHAWTPASATVHGSALQNTSTELEEKSDESRRSF